ncbi:MAG: response regulator [Ruminococcaceae bacterium]|jgi:CheY-like chemotaxis protein|nr:response regulator [Oscillospiraceae bacterium]
MSEEFAQKVFNAFERASTADSSGVQGTGLGMAITKSIIEMMHGMISVDTAPGKGTTFTVNLTLTAAQEPAVGGASAGLCGSMDCSKLLLLLVEDNEINREIATLLLREQGFRLDTAVNGREAVDMVAAAPGAYDAVLMDVQMPLMNGYDATHAIRALDDPAAAGVPIIAMTANAFQEDVRDALEAGMDAHIAKPFDIEKIMETLSGVLSKKRS